jgi:hypothetical protein
MWPVDKRSKGALQEDDHRTIRYVRVFSEWDSWQCRWIESGLYSVPTPLSRTALSVGLSWASRVTTLGLTFALPPLVGYAIDRQAGTIPWGTLVGAVLGMAVGLVRLVDLAKRASRPEQASARRTRRRESQTR